MGGKREGAREGRGGQSSMLFGKLSPVGRAPCESRSSYRGLSHGTCRGVGTCHHWPVKALGTPNRLGTQGSYEYISQHSFRDSTHRRQELREVVRVGLRVALAGIMHIRREATLVLELEVVLLVGVVRLARGQLV
jgi:hypothetical protein